jgi:hypothetical protein
MPTKVGTSTSASSGRSKLSIWPAVRMVSVSIPAR